MEHQGQRNGEGGHHDQRIGRHEKVRRLECKKMRPSYWRWKSRSPGGRPRIAQEVRDLIRRMSFENPLWGCAFRKSYPDVMVVQPRQDWDGDNDAGPLHCPT
jgi:hypothetical protein